MQAPTHTHAPTSTPSHATPHAVPHATVEAVLRTLLDPHADFLDAAQSLRLTLVEFLAIAESPPVIQAIESLERLADLRARALLAKSAHTAIAALERIAASLPETPSATETVRKAAAQLLRMAAKATVPASAPCATGGPPARADPHAPTPPLPETDRAPATPQEPALQTHPAAPAIDHPPHPRPHARDRQSVPA